MHLDLTHGFDTLATIASDHGPVNRAFDALCRAKTISKKKGTPGPEQKRTPDSVRTLE